MSAVYVPVLKSLGGELAALSRVRAPSTAVVPLLEAVKNSGTKPLSVQVAEIAKRVTNWAAKRPLFVDASSLDIGTPTAPSWTTLFSGIAGSKAIPVVRLANSAPQLAALVSAGSLGATGCAVRVVVTDLATLPTLASRVSALLTTVGVGSVDADLLLDMGYVDSVSVGSRAVSAQAAIVALRAVGPWRTETLISGAFPKALTVPTYTPTPLLRYDAQLWMSVTAGPLGTLGFGDYTVSHPVSAGTVGFRSAPNIRYARDRDWLIFKGDLTTHPGNEALFHLVDQLKAQPGLFTPKFSWGDEEWDARDTGALVIGTPGPGGGREWRAWSTSHHIEFIAGRLSTLGVP